MRADVVSYENKSLVFEMQILRAPFEIPQVLPHSHQNWRMVSPLYLGEICCTSSNTKAWRGMEGLQN